MSPDGASAVSPGGSHGESRQSRHSESWGGAAAISGGKVQEEQLLLVPAIGGVNLGEQLAWEDLQTRTRGERLEKNSGDRNWSGREQEGVLRAMIKKNLQQ